MLKVYFGNLEGAKRSGNDWFDNVLGYDCIETDFAKKVIKDIDGNKVVGKNLLISDVLGPISPEWLSGGCKALLCLKFSDMDFMLSAFGENCYKYIGEISKEKDISIGTNFMVDFFRDMNVNEVYCLNNNKKYIDKELKELSFVYLESVEI